jgi:hypothetical protein
MKKIKKSSTSLIYKLADNIITYPENLEVKHALKSTTTVVINV